jgi:hypothetical protein
MKFLLGILCLATIIGALYVSVWLLFIGGIVQCVQAFMEPFSSMTLAKGLLRICVSPIPIAIEFFLLLAIGFKRAMLAFWRLK